MGSQVIAQKSTASRVVVESTTSEPTSRNLAQHGPGVLLLLTLVLAFVNYWYPMLTSDLRFDENLTGWVVQGSLVETIERSWTHQGQSPLYFMVIWVWQNIVGSSEIALRLPSMVALFLSVWQLYALGKDLDQRRVGQFAGIFLLVVETGATDARPYTFMILALIVSARFGFRWLDTRAVSDGLVWVVAAVVAIAMQPFAVYALVPHLVIAYRAFRQGRTTSVLGHAALGALLVAPIVPQILMLRARQDTLVIADAPTIMEFVLALLPAQMCAGFVLATFLDRHPRSLPLRPTAAVGFVLLWAVGPAFGLFAQSHLTGSSVFVDRYYVAAVPATAFVVAWFLASLKPWAGLAGAVVVVLVGVVLVDPVGSRDWYGAVESLDRAPVDAEIWTVTGYIESNNPDAFVDHAANEYLNAPLRWHGATQDLLAIPRTSIDANRRIIDANVESLHSLDSATVVLVESVEGDARQSGPLYAEEALLADGFEIVGRQPEFAVLVTTFTSLRE